MFTRRSQTFRRLLVVGVIFAALMALVPLASAQRSNTPSVIEADHGSSMAAREIAGQGASGMVFGGIMIGLALLSFAAILAGRVGIERAPSIGDRSQRSGSRSQSAEPSLPVFPNYLQLRSRSRLSPRFWMLARSGAVIGALIYVAVLLADPAFGLFLWWRLTIPLLPLLFLVAPGVWRNVCPLAASNQTPRLLKFSRALTPPAWLREYGFVIGAAAFFLFASSRKWLFNTNGPATGLLILAALASAMLGGYLFKGKSGWCSSICPLYPVQRFYNRTPLVTVPNAYCTPCVGCTKNCYDFNPGTAYLSDLYDDDRHYAAYRKFFAAAMPGFIVAYFTVPDPIGAASVLSMYLQFALYMVVSIGVFSVLDSFLKVSANKLTVIYGAIAFNLFYLFGLPGWLKAAGSLVSIIPPTWLAWVLQAGILSITIVWIGRTFRRERLFLDQRQPAEVIPLASGPTPSLPATAPATKPEITFMPDNVRAAADASRTLLEIAEGSKQPINAMCRMGLCGADPVLVLNGMENLSPMSSEEKGTLERLGLGANCRLACMCRVKGPVTISLQTKEAALAAEADRVVSAAPVLQSPASSKQSDNQSDIIFMPNELRVPIDSDRSLLEIAEGSNQPIEAGCRMGVCGADPVVVLDGMENLSPMGSDEKNTLERLGLGSNCRLACMCRVKGPVTVSTDTKGTAVPAPAPTQAIDYDRGIKSVVIVGNGIAGVTAADYVRRHHPECEIHIISREKHHFYNRMAITRLIYGRSAMTGLYLQPEAWYDERKITCWLNTHVTHLNRGHRQVTLATGETLNYDRLILASGSSSFVPPIPGADLPGSFVLREAEEAMEIRSYVQKHQCRTAVIAGGGLLGLEAAYALHKMGLTVWVLERGEWLLRRQLDQRGGHFLKQYLEALGITIVTRAETAAVQGDGRVSQVTLKDERTLPCDVFLVAVGIKPNVELARAAGLEVNHGVLVDQTMRTNAPDIFAAGDVCEFAQQVPGLWGVAVEQAKVAAINAVGGQATYQEVVPVTMLKVVGVDMTSIGRFEARSDAEIEIALEDVKDHRYRKLVIADDRIVGAILLGYPQDALAVTTAVKEGHDVSRCLDALRAGQWAVLRETKPKPSVPEPPKARAKLPARKREVEFAERELQLRQPPIGAVALSSTSVCTLVINFKQMRCEVDASYERVA